MFYNRNPSRLPFNQSSFSFRPLNWKFRGGGGGPYRSHSELSRPQRVASWPPGLNERGVRGEIREALACVAAFCLPGDRGPAEQPPPPPPSKQQYNGKQGSGEILDARAHTRHSPLSYTIYFVLFGSYKEEKGGAFAEPLKSHPPILAKIHKMFVLLSILNSSL